MTEPDANMFLQIFKALLADCKGDSYKMERMVRLCSHMHTIAQGTKEYAEDPHKPFAHRIPVEVNNSHREARALARAITPE